MELNYTLHTEQFLSVPRVGGRIKQGVVDRWESLHLASRDPKLQVRITGTQSEVSDQPKRGCIRPTR